MSFVEITKNDRDLAVSALLKLRQEFETPGKPVGYIGFIYLNVALVALTGKSPEDLATHDAREHGMPPY